MLIRLSDPRRLWAAMLVAALFCLTLAGNVWAQSLTFPALTDRVVDQANILTPASRARLTAKLAEHDQKSSDQIVVATIPSLQGTSIEDYSNQLFRFWKLGQAKTNNGVLILIAPNDRKMRIEVGYGLEGTLTDAMSSIIINAAMAPKFRAGDFSGGIEAGVDGVIAALTGNDEWKQRAAQRPQAQEQAYDPIALIAFIFLLFVVISILRANKRNNGQYYRSRSGNWVVIPSAREDDWSRGSSSGGWSSGSSDSGGFSGGGGDSGGGGASGSW